MTMKTITFYLTEDLKRDFKLRTIREGSSMRDALTKMVAEYVSPPVASTGGEICECIGWCEHENVYYSECCGEIVGDSGLCPQCKEHTGRGDE